MSRSATMRWKILNRNGNFCAVDYRTLISFLKCSILLGMCNENSFHSYTNAFKSKTEFEDFLRETYNDNRYSYCMLKCGPSVPHRQQKATQRKDSRIPRNMGWNWKLTHAEVSKLFLIGHR